jgi:hypothetical protein
VVVGANTRFEPYSALTPNAILHGVIICGTSDGRVVTNRMTNTTQGITGTGTGGCLLHPLRQAVVTPDSGLRPLYYDPLTFEVVYASVLNPAPA